jgi:branched-chain amino acid transport system permease protein
VSNLSRLPARAAAPSPRTLLEGLRTRRLLLCLAIAVALAIVPFTAPLTLLTILDLVALATIGAVALNVLSGVAGQVSIGNAAFMAVGAFTTVLVVDYLHLPILVSVVAAALAGGLAGVVVGLPALRIRGWYLGVSTLAAQFIVVYIAQQWQIKTVGPAGFQLPLPGDLTGSDLTRLWYFVFIVPAALCLLGMSNLLKTQLGRQWSMIRVHDDAAALLGINVARSKLTVFTLSSMVFAVQGCLYAYYVGVVTADLFTFNLAVSYVAMIIVGGEGSAIGSLLGAAFVTAIPYLVQSVVEQFPQAPTALLSDVFSIQLLLYGLLIVVFVLFEPRGLIGIVERARRWRRQEAVR